MATFHPGLQRRPRAVGVRIGVAMMVLLVIAGAWAGAIWWAKSTGQLKPIERAVAQYDYVWPHWMGKGAKKATYVDDKPEVNGIDPRDAELKRLQRELEEQRRLLELMRQQKMSTPATAKPATPIPTIKRPPMHFVSYEHKGREVNLPDTYVLAPGATKFACVVETKFSSDIDSLFTAKVTRPIFDTATGQHLLVPQQATILGQASGESLVFGNERLPTMSLTLAFPDGRSIEIGDAPVLNREGVTGLVSSVNHHWLRNFGAVLIMGVLRGGQQLIQQEIATAGGAGQVAAGVASVTNQVGTQSLTRAIDTRPTIIVEAGEGCNVLLRKPLRLPVYAAAGR
jgi:type IV secretory pathway VirB10-like protein